MLCALVLARPYSLARPGLQVTRRPASGTYIFALVDGLFQTSLSRSNAM